MVNACVFVNEILCETIIGIYPDELFTPQKIEFGFSFEYDCKPAIISDSIEHAIDYAVLTKELKQFVTNSKFNLLETLTVKIAEKILAFSAKITKTNVYCIKLNSLKPKIKLELKRG